MVLEHEVGLALVLVLRALQGVVHGHALARLLAHDVHVVRVVLLAVRDGARDGVARLHGVPLSVDHAKCWGSQRERDESNGSEG